jgi:cysteine sulfinate desulfinase/cysteine desulfurase-like protein
MGLSEADAYSTIRFSWGPETTDEDLSEALRVLESELSADRGPRTVAVA